MREAIAVVIIILSVAMVALVLVQSKGADLGGFLGGGGGDGVQRTRRGVEAIMHTATIWLAVAFFIFILAGFFLWGS